MPETRKILIIGWKAGDPFILEKLKDIKNPIELVVVSKDKTEAKEVAKIVGMNTQIKSEVLCDGFSNFIGSLECREFFNK